MARRGGFAPSSSLVGSVCGGRALSIGQSAKREKERGGGQALSGQAELALTSRLSRPAGNHRRRG
eukprot:15447323-Alexandrium_andersonii.AAC.1